MFKHMPKNEKVEIIRSNFTKLLKAVDFLHTKKDMVIRDLKDTNVLMKRKFDKDKLNHSIYEIQLIDFGMSKDLENEDLDVQEFPNDETPLNRASSIRI